MSAVPFDTLKYAEALKTAGVPDPQAKAQAEALADVLRQGGLATKADIVELRMATGADLKTGLAELEARIQTMLNRHLLAIMGAMVGLTAIFGTVVVIALRLVK